MKIARPLFRMVVPAGLLLVLAVASTTIIVPAAARAQGSCPPILASLFPKNASVRDGNYRPGDMGMGKGSADVSFDDPICPKQPFSARVTVEVKYYGGEMAILIKSAESPYGSIDWAAMAERTMTDATSELQQTRLTPKREKLGIGQIVYVERKTECPPEGPATTAARVGAMIVPNVKLKGVAWTKNANIEIELDGLISVDLAKASVAEVFTNFQKTDFSKAK